MRPHQRGKTLYKLLGAIVGLFLIISGFNERSALSSVQKHGKRAIVDSISQYTEFRKGGSSTYTAEFRFKTEDGRQITMKHSFPEEVLAGFKASKPVEVVYLPSDPNTFVFAHQKASWTLVSIGTAIFLAALLLV
ncbi:DUF3592 domain-containing protein [Acidovorax sp. ACV01]|nr:DUF3592 domain-containing protein [Acidovorax sp. ACV01]